MAAGEMSAAHGGAARRWLTVLVALVAVPALVALATVVASRQNLEPPAVDLRYFHPRADDADAGTDIGYASMQVKGVAASRQVPVRDVRRLMEDHTANRDGLPGRQRVDVRKLNEALDERWPIK